MWGAGALGRMGDNTSITKSSPIQVGTLTNWTSLAIGRDGVMSAKTDGSLWGWGYNLHGQIGDSSVLNRSSPVQVGTMTNWVNTIGGISLSGSRATAVKTDGTWWAWGYRGAGNGDGSASFAMSPVQIGTDTNWRRVSAGATHTEGIQDS